MVMADEQFDNDGLQAASRKHLHSQAVSTLTKQKKTNVPFLGIGLALLSGMLFSTMSLCAKVAVGVPAFEVALCRSFIAFVCFIPLVLWFIDGPLLGPNGERRWLCARGVTGILGMSCGLYGVKFLPLGDATVLIFMTPIFTGILSKLTLKEPWGVWQAVASVTSFAGVVFIARPTFLFKHSHGVSQLSGTGDGASSSHNFSAHTENSSSDQHGLAVGITFLGALLTACAYVIGRRVSQRVHYLVIGLYFSAIGIPVCSAMDLMFEQAVVPWSANLPKMSSYFLLGVGLFGVASFCALNKALSLESAAMVALVRNVNVIIAYVYQVIFFGDTIRLYSGVGAVLILSSTGGVAWLKYRRER